LPALRMGCGANCTHSAFRTDFGVSDGTGGLVTTAAVATCAATDRSRHATNSWGPKNKAPRHYSLRGQSAWGLSGGLLEHKRDHPLTPCTLEDRPKCATDVRRGVATPLLGRLPAVCFCRPMFGCRLCCAAHVAQNTRMSRDPAPPRGEVKQPSPSFRVTPALSLRLTIVGTLQAFHRVQ
jgi:hypothetical protein